MMIVHILMFVTREVVLTHVVYLIAEPPPNANQVVIRHDVYVYQDTQEILALHALYVSKKFLFALSVFSCFSTFHTLSCMTLF